MNELRSGTLNSYPFKKDPRTGLLILGMLLAGSLVVLVLQSFVYDSSLLQLWESGQDVWGPVLSLMLQILAIWSAVLGAVYAIRNVTTPTTKYGGEFWEGVVTGFPLGLVLPFLLTLGIGCAIFIPIGLLSLLVTDVFEFACLQFAWLAAGFLVFLWIIVGIIPVLVGLFRLPRWYDKFVAVLLYTQLTLDILQSGLAALQILFKNSTWQTNIAAIVALFGSLLVSIVLVFWTFRGQPALLKVYAVTGVYLASVVTGNLSERLFQWGEVPSAALALLAPLLYLQAAKWIQRKDGTAIAALVAGYAGLLAGLLVTDLLQLRITGHGWISLLWGIIIVLGVGLALGYFLGRRVNKFVAARLNLLPVLLKWMDAGLVAGMMAGMLVGGFLAR